MEGSQAIVYDGNILLVCLETMSILNKIEGKGTPKPFIHPQFSMKNFPVVLIRFGDDLAVKELEKIGYTGKLSLKSSTSVLNQVFVREGGETEAIFQSYSNTWSHVTDS